MSTVEFKQPTLPRCPRIEEIRGTFTEMNEQLRAARHKYLSDLWQAAEHLSGDALLTFLVKGAERMAINGLYSASTIPGDIIYSVVNHIFKRDVPRHSYGDKQRWCAKRGIDTSKIRKMKWSQKPWRKQA